jgi:phage tail-like protein
MSFPSGSQRSDPYQNFKVRLIVDGTCVYGGNCAHSNAPVPGLAAYAAGARYRSGGDSLNPRKLPGSSQYPALTLERGVSLDQSFLNWAKQVSSWGTTGRGPQVPPANFRKDINLEQAR